MVFDGLASDAVLAVVGARLAAIRLVFPPAASKRCCAGHQPAFIAISSGDPGLTQLDRVAVSAVDRGRAVPGIGLPALGGGIVALPGLSLDIAQPRELGPGLEHAVVLTLADAARGLLQAGETDAMVPRTVALVHPGDPAPLPWRAASRTGARVSLDAGLHPSATYRVAA